MKKVLVLIAAAITAAFIFLLVWAVCFVFTVNFSGGTILGLFLLAYLVHANVSFALAVCAEKAKGFFVNRVSLNPLAFYAAVFLPSLICSVMCLITVSKGEAAAYLYSQNPQLDHGLTEMFVLYMAISYLAFVVLTAVVCLIINLCGKK